LEFNAVDGGKDLPLDQWLTARSLALVDH